jgi:A/G-specific adenine glycosylase
LKDDVAIARAVEQWFAGAARDLPWRSASSVAGQRRNPYHALVAESMLQQTQVSRVIEKFEAFIARFPTVAALAAADEQDVLGAWTGLGYYRRARNLHAAAKRVVEAHGARVPREAGALLELKGVGRYTAGAISSIAFDEAEPIVDGNVARVLLRIHGRDASTDDKSVQSWLWERATSLVRSAASPGAFNEGLMELGATVCLPPPGRPMCDKCPVRERCEAFRTGRQMAIPKPKSSAKRREVMCISLRVERADGALLVEQRGEAGMWSGMWQAPTIERAATEPAPTIDELAQAVGVDIEAVEEGETFAFTATHRSMRFMVYRVRVGATFAPRRGLFKTREELAGLGLSTPQRRVLSK